MQRNPWREAVASSADPKRVQRGLEALGAVLGEAAVRRLAAEQMRVLLALFAGAPACGDALVAHPEWLGTVLAPDQLDTPHREEHLRREVGEFLRIGLKKRDYTGALGQLRQFKQREHLRIVARELARLVTVAEIARELADLADACLNAVLQICRARLTGQVGSPWHRDANERWQPTPFCVLGAGRLGGLEMDHDSELELLFVYAEEGEVGETTPDDTTRSGLSNHAFFQRLAGEFIGELTRLTPEGTLYRVNSQPRVEGDTTPLARSLTRYENFYSQHGQAQDRLMLIRARTVAGDPALGAEFLAMVQPFRHPRYLSERVFVELAAHKQQLLAETARQSRGERDVRYVRGGTSEIEFIVQALQLLHGGKTPFLQTGQTLSALERLVRYRLLTADESLGLTEAWCFLRELEHRLQLEGQPPTLTLPAERKARERIATLMNSPRLSDFETARQQHGERVQQLYDKLLKIEESTARSPLPRNFAEHEREWFELLAAHSFREPAKAIQTLKEFIHGPATDRATPRTRDLAWDLVPRLFALCPDPQGESRRKSSTHKPAASQAGRLAAAVLSDPDRVLARLTTFTTAYGARTSLFKAWSHHPKVFDLLLWLFDRSEFLAELAIRTPDLVEDLEESDRLRHAKTTAEILTELRHGLNDEDQHDWLRRYFQTEFMRIGLRGILGLADFEEHLTELSALAGACLQYVLEIVLRRHHLRSAPLTIIGFGKLGGAELTYGSALELAFVTDDKARDLVALSGLAGEVLDLLAANADLAKVFPAEIRLRPDTVSLVHPLAAYERFFLQRASLKEILSLSRANVIAGDTEIGREFVQLSIELCDFRPDAQRAARPTQGLGATSDTVRIAGRVALDTGLQNLPRARPACFTAEWMRDLARLRRQTETADPPAANDILAFKTGAGGVLDAELIARAFCLARGWHEPGTLRALERSRQANALPPKDGEILVASYRQLRRLEAILCRWSHAAEMRLPEDLAAQRRVALRCGFTSAAALLKALAGWRLEVRRVYDAVLPAAG